MAYGLGAHGIWHYGHLPSKFGCLPNAIGLQNRVTLTHLASGNSLEGVPGRACGRQVATQSRQRGPQSRHRAPQSRQSAPRHRPQGAQQREITKKRSPKHAPEQRRTMKKQGFPLVFVYFAESPWPMAFGPWPSTFGSRHKALGPQNRVSRPSLAPGRGV